MSTRSWLWSGWLLLLVFSSAQAGALQPADALGDHMVLQRNKPAPVWGTADPGEEVTVSFAGQKKKAVADSKGHWMLRLLCGNLQ